METINCPVCGFRFVEPQGTVETQCAECEHRWSLRSPEPEPKRVGPPPLPSTTSASNSETPTPPVPPPPIPTLQKLPTPRRRRRRDRDDEIMICGQFEYQCLGCGKPFETTFRHPTYTTRSEPDDAWLRDTVKAEFVPKDRVMCPRCEALSPKEIAKVRSKLDTLFGVLILVFSTTLSLITISPMAILAYWPMVAILLILNGVLLMQAFMSGAKPTLQLRDLDPKGDAVAMRYETLSRWPGYLLLMLAFVCFLVHPVRRGLVPLAHSKHTSPSVVVPGEKIRVSMPTTMQTYGGHWSGQANLKINNPDAFTRVPYIPVSTHQEGIQQSIATSGGYAQTVYTYLDIEFPNDPELYGKMFDLSLVLDVTYPRPISATSYDYSSTTVEKKVQLTVVDPNKVGMDQRVGIVSSAAALCFLFVGVLWLRRSNAQLQTIQFPVKLTITEVKERAYRD